MKKHYMLSNYLGIIHIQFQLNHNNIQKYSCYINCLMYYKLNNYLYKFDNQTLKYHNNIHQDNLYKLQNPFNKFYKGNHIICINLNHFYNIHQHNLCILIMNHNFYKPWGIIDKLMHPNKNQNYMLLQLHKFDIHQCIIHINYQRLYNNQHNILYIYLQYTLCMLDHKLSMFYYHLPNKIHLNKMSNQLMWHQYI